MAKIKRDEIGLFVSAADIITDAHSRTPLAERRRKFEYMKRHIEGYALGPRDHRVYVFPDGTIVDVGPIPD